MLEQASSMQMQVSFSAAQNLWLVLPALLTHAHLWVRKAALRLLCLGVSSPALGEPVSCCCTKHDHPALPPPAP